MMKQNLKDSYQGVFDRRIGFGEKPAILVVDFVKAYITPGHPLYAQDVVTALKESKPLLDSARRNQIPIIFTKVQYQANLLDGGLFVKKIPVLQSFLPDEPMTDIAFDIRPLPEDLVITKQYASSFFGTSLASSLTALKIDTLVIIGCSTSGCIRATAVDGIQHGLRVIIPRECVGDRHIEIHEANLFDIDSKYGDVLAKSEVIAYLEGLT